MSLEKQQDESLKEDENEFIDVNEVAEVVPDQDNEDLDESMSEGEEEVEGEGSNIEIPEGQDFLEISMANNSSSYFDKHTDSIFMVKSHPTLPIVVSGGGDNMGYIWTTKSNPSKIITTLTNHTESIITGGFTNDGEFLITGDMSGKVRVWHSLRRGQIWEFYGSLDEVDEITWITIHPKQNVFAFGAQDGSVWVYQLSPSLDRIMTGFAHSLETTAGIFVNTNDLDSLTLITSSEDGTIVSWNVYMGTQNYKLGNSQFKGNTPWVTLSLNDDETTIAAGSREGKLSIIATKNGHVISNINTYKNENDINDCSIEALSWCGLLPILAIGNVKGEITLYDTGSWRIRKLIQCEGVITKLQFLKKSVILISSDTSGVIKKWDVRTGEEKFVGVGHNDGILDFTIQENGKRLITAGDEGVSLVFNDETI